MFRFFKEWYDSHLTDPNQVALALIILFITLVTYILLATVAPILVAIILGVYVGRNCTSVYCK